MATGPRFGFYYAVASVPLMGAGIFGPEVFNLSLEAKTICILLLRWLGYPMRPDRRGEGTECRGSGTRHAWA